MTISRKLLVSGLSVAASVILICSATPMAYADNPPIVAPGSTTTYSIPAPSSKAGGITPDIGLSNVCSITVHAPQALTADKEFLFGATSKCQSGKFTTQSVCVWVQGLDYYGDPGQTAPRLCSGQVSSTTLEKDGSVYCSDATDYKYYTKSSSIVYASNGQELTGSGYSGAALRSQICPS